MADDLTGRFDDDAGFHYQEPDRTLRPVAYFPSDGTEWIGLLDPPVDLDRRSTLSPVHGTPHLTEGMRVSIDGRTFTVAAALPGGHYVLEEEVPGD